MQCWQWPPDVGRSHGCVTNVSWRDFTSSADGVALAWSLILLVLFHKTLPSYLPVVLKYWRWVFGMGGIGLAGFTLFLVYAAQHTTAVNLGIMQGVIPAFVMLLGWLIYRTSIGWFQFLGFVHHFWGFSARQCGQLCKHHCT